MDLEVIVAWVVWGVRTYFWAVVFTGYLMILYTLVTGSPIQ